MRAPVVVSAGLEAARQTRALHLALVLLLPVPFLLVAHQLHLEGVAGFGSPRWNTNLDRSSIEVLGYLQVVAAVLAMLVVWRRGRGRVYAGWAVGLAVIVLDDALELHERVGSWLAQHVALPVVPGLLERDVGQLLTWAGLGAVSLLVLLATHRGSPAAARRDSWLLGGLVAVLMVFAVVVDMAHRPITAVHDSGAVELLLMWVEAGGEVTTMTALLAFALHVERRDRHDADAPAYADDEPARAAAAATSRPR